MNGPMSMPTGQRRVLLDANVLLLLLVGTVDRALIGSFKRTAIFTEDDFDLLNLVLAYFHEIVTTPHVLTEASNLLGQLPSHLSETYFANFRIVVAAFNEQMNAAQVITTEPVFTQLGLTDAAITHVARARVLEVLTVDLDLWLHLTDQGITAHNFNHVRSHGMFN